MHSSSIGLALLCVGPVFALRPPPRRIAAKRTYAFNAAVLPTEACVALLYVAPLPPVGTIIGRQWRRIRGAAVDNGPLVAPPRDKNTRRHALFVLSYALRAAAPLSKVALFFVALRLSDLPRYGAPPDERTPSTPVVRHVAPAVAADRAHSRGRTTHKRGAGRPLGLRARVGKERRHIPGAMDPARGPGPYFARATGWRSR